MKKYNKKEELERTENLLLRRIDELRQEINRLAVDLTPQNKGKWELAHARMQEAQYIFATCLPRPLATRRPLEGAPTR